MLRSKKGSKVLFAILASLQTVRKLVPALHGLGSWPELTHTSPNRRKYRVRPPLRLLRRRLDRPILRLPRQLHRRRLHRRLRRLPHQRLNQVVRYSGWYAGPFMKSKL